MPPTRRQYFAIYIGWIALCSILFVLLRASDDPSRPHGRILSNEAGERAVALLNKPGYEAVHVAAAEDRWIVLCDRRPRTALRDAIVVELRASDGALLAMRKAVVR